MVRCLFFFVAQQGQRRWIDVSDRLIKRFCKTTASTLERSGSHNIFQQILIYTSKYYINYYKIIVLLLKITSKTCTVGLLMPSKNLIESLEKSKIYSLSFDLLYWWLFWVHQQASRQLLKHICFKPWDKASWTWWKITSITFLDR